MAELPQIRFSNVFAMLKLNRLRYNSDKLLFLGQRCYVIYHTNWNKFTDSILISVNINAFFANCGKINEY